MQTSLFDFEIPDACIAEFPSENRDQSRLMVVDKKSGQILIKKFWEIQEFLVPGDVLVLNNSKVIPASLTGYRKSGGSHEVLLIEALTQENTTWECLVKRCRRLQIGEWLLFNAEYCAEVLEKKPNGVVRIRFNKALKVDMLSEIGHVPLPPYITKKRSWTQADEKWYQTVYAKKYGSIACPTAGLHFTQALLDQLKNHGIQITEVTLHVSMGTFRIIQTPEIEGHQMDTEFYEISDSAASIINQAIIENRRIIGTGTTVTRTLESAEKNGKIKAGVDSTNIFITPKYPFKIIKGLITNFHLPKSTPLVLAASFSGYELLKKAYDLALQENLRFFSYGDAMLIL